MISFGGLVGMITGRSTSAPEPADQGVAIGDSFAALVRLAARSGGTAGDDATPLRLVIDNAGSAPAGGAAADMLDGIGALPATILDPSAKAMLAGLIGDGQAPPPETEMESATLLALQAVMQARASRMRSATGDSDAPTDPGEDDPAAEAALSDDAGDPPATDDGAATGAAATVSAGAAPPTGQIAALVATPAPPPILAAQVREPDATGSAPGRRGGGTMLAGPDATGGDLIGRQPTGLAPAPGAGSLPAPQVSTQPAPIAPPAGAGALPPPEVSTQPAPIAPPAGVDGLPPPQVSTQPAPIAPPAGAGALPPPQVSTQPAPIAPPPADEPGTALADGTDASISPGDPALRDAAAGRLPPSLATVLAGLRNGRLSAPAAPLAAAPTAPVGRRVDGSASALAGSRGDAALTDPAALPEIDLTAPGAAERLASNGTGTAVDGQSPGAALPIGLSPEVRTARTDPAMLTRPLGATIGATLGDRVIDIGVSNQWLDRMAQEIATLSQGGGTSRFVLSPPHLGRLDVEIALDQDVTNIRMRVETDEAARRLSDARPAIQADGRLAALPIGSFTVEKTQNGFDQPRDQGGNRTSGGDPNGQTQQQLAGGGQGQAGARPGADQSRSGWAGQPARHDIGRQGSDEAPTPASVQGDGEGRVRFA